MGYVYNKLLMENKEIMFNFRYLKPYYSEVEILELFNISKSTLQRYREECERRVETYLKIWAIFILMELNQLCMSQLNFPIGY